MKPKRRKVEVHKLTISGLDENQGYNQFITSIYKKAGSLNNLVLDLGSKSHALKDAYLRNNRLRLRFLSFATGYRPDILDTNKFTLSPNPLTPNQTGVEWTHALGRLHSNKFLLLIERVQSGLHPSTMEGYLQWMIDEYYEVKVETSNSIADKEPVTVSLEQEAGIEFINRINSLDRITKASLRIVRPNPGWADLEEELGNEAEESDAHKADVIMSARRNSTLSKSKGIIGAIKKLFAKRQLDYASIEGEKDQEKDSFNTKKLGRHKYITVDQDDRGQVIEEEIWKKLSKTMDNLD